MERGTSRIWSASGLLASLAALCACATQAPSPSPSPSPSPQATGVGESYSPAPTGTAASPAVRVTFYGSVAFVPTSPTQTPMSTGSADSVLAVLPRAFDEDMLASPPVPDPQEFNPPDGKHHEAHQLMLKIPAASLGWTGTDEVVIPVRPPSGATEVYEITVEGVASSSTRLQYSGFSSVAPVLSDTADPPRPSRASTAAVLGAAALARMRLGSGWTLTVPTVPYPPPSGTTAFLQCPKTLSCAPEQASSVPEREFALSVQAESPPATGAVAIKISSGATTVLRLPVFGSSPIAMKVLHAPASEMFGGTMSTEAMHHFKLFYLLAESPQRRYFYPQLPHAAAHAVMSDPFCTPVAQF